MYFKKITWFMSAVLLFLTLAACGDAPDVAPTSSPATAPQTVQTVPTEAAVEPPEPTAVPDPTEAPEPTTVPTAEPEPEPTIVPTTEPTAVPEPVGPTAGPDLILAAQPGLFPEGIEYDAANGRFLLGSIGEGTVYAVSDDGTFQPFIEDEDLLSTIGLEIDAERNRLLVANTAYIFTDPTLTSQAYLGIYDLATGERLDMIDLLADAPGGDHFANDIAVDADGNAYVTDSMGGVFKVDATGRVSSFIGEAEGVIAPNGIIYHPDGYLLITNTAEGSLYKAPVDDPGSASRVELDQPIFGDGLVWEQNGSLAVVEYVSGSILSLSSSDGWETAVIAAVSPNHPASTIAARGDQIYAIYPHFSELSSGTSPEAFEIVLVEFGE